MWGGPHAGLSPWVIGTGWKASEMVSALGTAGGTHGGYVGPVQAVTCVPSPAHQCIPQLCACCGHGHTHPKPTAKPTA